MEIDYPHADSVDIPNALRDHVIYKCRAYKNAKQYSQLIVTGGANAAFYEIQQTNILCSCNISRLNCFKDLPWKINESQRSPLQISLNIYFSYRKKQKETFYFLQINDALVVLGKDCQRLIVHREFNQIKSYRCVDDTNQGDMCVEIIYADDASEEFQLSSMGYHKAIDSRYTSDSGNRFARLTQALEENVATINSTLATTNSTIQKAMHEFKTNCHRIGNDEDEETSILAQYGDIWMKNINGKLLVGIPVYNCSSRKYVIENICVSLYATAVPELLFQQQLYTFETENGCIEPVNLQAMCNRGHGIHNDLLFGHEWTRQKEYTLLPDNAAIVVAELNLDDILSRESTCMLNIFLLYDVCTSSGSTREHQLSLETITIDTDVLHDKRFAVQFEANDLFRDLLSVISTSERQMFLVRFEGDDRIIKLYECMEQQFGFDKISTSLDINEHFRLFPSQHFISMLDNDDIDEDHRIFYCSKECYWTGTLVRTRVIDDTYLIKVYHPNENKIMSIINAIRNQFGRMVSIEATSRHMNRTLLELELDYQFRSETRAIEQLATHIQNKADAVQLAYEQLFAAQQNTDRICREFFENKS